MLCIVLATNIEGHLTVLTCDQKLVNMERRSVECLAASISQVCKVLALQASMTLCELPTHFHHLMIAKHRAASSRCGRASSPCSQSMNNAETTSSKESISPHVVCWRPCRVIVKCDQLCVISAIHGVQDTNPKSNRIKPSSQRNQLYI